jgi:cysteine desulfurase
VAQLREDLRTAVLAAVPDARVVTPEADVLPGIVSVVFAGCDADALLMLLDAAGVECSTGSACTAGIPEPSRVLAAMGASAADARSALRFSLGWTSTSADIEELAAALPAAVARARRASAAGRRAS